MAFPILGVFQVVGEIFNNWMAKKKVEAEGKVKIAAAKVEGEIALATKTLESEGAYNVAAQEGMRYSWKDEWLTILLSMPFIGCFIPAAQPYVEKGFNVLKNSTPDWYQWAFLGVIVASFGLKGWNVFKTGQNGKEE